VGLESTVTVFPRDGQHRLVGPDLASFLDRLAERVVALGSGARARVRAGRFDAEVDTIQDLTDTVEAARSQAQGREDLELRLWGPPQASFGKFLGARHLEIKFCAWVQPHLLLDAQLCPACRWPLDLEGYSEDMKLTCGRPGCPNEGEFTSHTTVKEELRACWWLRLFGSGSEGIGERFVEEDRRLEGSSFFEMLEGCSRTRLLEWHTWA
jgi:hypothetical protein